MVTPGPWRDDALPAWLRLATTSTADTAASWGWISYAALAGAGWDAQMHAAWDGADDLTYPLSGVAPELDVQDSAASFYLSWVSLHNDGVNPVASSATLPPDVADEAGNFLDPAVVGVEWEPTSVTDTQRLVVAITNDVVQHGEVFSVKMRSGITEAYVPPFTSAATVAAETTVETITIDDFAPRSSATFDDPPMPLNADGWIAVTVLDPYTQAQTPPQDLGNGYRQLRYPFRLTLEGAFTPRFRLLYERAPQRQAPLRVVQRGNDGLGMSGGRRAVQGRTIQASNRVSGIR